MTEEKAISALDDDVLVAVLRMVDSCKARATMAMVSKTWRSCVRRSWNSAHFCFRSEETLKTQMLWLGRQLLDNPFLLQSPPWCNVAHAMYLLMMGLVLAQRFRWCPCLSTWGWSASVPFAS